MSDNRSPASRPDGADPGAPRRATRIPPLVWIILALLIGWFVVAMMQRGGSDRTPQGGEVPRQAEGPAIMPPAPPSGSAPATPGGVVNGPDEPPASNAGPQPPTTK
jgi:hypothetical protein